MAVRAIEHGTSRTARRLREWRFRLALWIAVVEGVLVVFDVIPGWVALVVGAAVLAFHFTVGRELPPAGRQASWIAALSQVFVALIPVFTFVLGVLAIIALAVIAAVALVALLSDRR